MDLSTWVKLFSLCYWVSLVTADQCVKRSPCSCVFPNGTGIDLASSANTSYYTSKQHFQELMDGTKMVISTFFFHPCSDVRMTTRPGVKTTCNLFGYASICHHENVWLKGPDDLRQVDESYHYIGSANNTQFAPDGSYIKYLYGPMNTIVHLVCADMDDKITVEDLSEPNKFKLQFFSRNACFRRLEPSQSQGTTGMEDIPIRMPPIPICAQIPFALKGVLLERGYSGFPGVSRGHPDIPGGKGDIGYPGIPGNQVTGMRGTPGPVGPPGAPDGRP